MLPPAPVRRLVTQLSIEALASEPPLNLFALRALTDIWPDLRLPNQGETPNLHAQLLQHGEIPFEPLRVLGASDTPRVFDMQINVSSRDGFEHTSMVAHGPGAEVETADLRVGRFGDVIETTDPRDVALDPTLLERRSPMMRAPQQRPGQRRRRSVAPQYSSTVPPSPQSTLAPKPE